LSGSIDCDIENKRIRSPDFAMTKQKFIYRLILFYKWLNCYKNRIKLLIKYLIFIIRIKIYYSKIKILTNIDKIIYFVYKYYRNFFSKKLSK